MQGTVWAGLICTSSMDKLAQQAYSDPTLLYKYRNNVSIPPLKMVNDVICASKCGTQVVDSNTAVTSFVQLKKLQLSEKKCARLHVGQSKCDECPQILVNGQNIQESSQEKYLGDFLNNKANASTTLQDRKRKGNGILADIRAILEDIPLGNRRLETGLLLRESWFINGTLYNSEVWGSFTKSDMKCLEILDRKILKLVLGAQCKSQSEMLFLEAGALPLSHILSIRRLCYLRTILQRDEKEITKRVYRAQKKNPVSGDWVLLIQED